MELKSSAFGQESRIPAKYTCQGEEVSPPFELSNVPEQAKSIVIIVHDPDVPKKLQEEKGAPAEWAHWVIFNIDPSTREIGEGSVPTGSVQGVNSAGKNVYQGPCPLKGMEPEEHRYFFNAYALDTVLDLPEGSSRNDVEKAMRSQVLDKAELIGLYKQS